MSGERIGLIGHGLLGSAIAGRLRSAGFVVVAYDRDPERSDVASASDVARTCARIVLSLPDASVSTAVIAEIEGVLGDGAIVIDTTTGEPAEMEALGGRVATRGAKYLDATVGGSSAQMAAGEAVIMVGGDRAAFERCGDLFAAMSMNVRWLGGNGAGARMKLVFNLALGLHRAVLAEALVFAERTGVDPAAALEVLKSGAAYSRVMDTKGAKMLASEYTPVARLSQHLKDVRLINATAAESGAPTPMSALHQRILEEAEAVGHGQEDNSAVIEWFRRRSRDPA